jgi:peptidoglycan/LPS O-acetylase OafA/YrhL
MKSTHSLFYRLFVAPTEIPANLKVNYFPSLDGFRALTIILVVIYHVLLNPNFHSIIINGSLGVDIFFIISGFLITTLLLKERVRTQSISLKKFYGRRFLRIFPVAYIFLSVIIGISLLFHYKLDKTYLMSCFLYLTDISKLGREHTNWAVRHFWSLAVEEQFYFIFPFIMKKNFKAYVLTLLFILLFLPLYFVVSAEFPVLDVGPIYSVTRFLIKFQGIAVGSLAAILVFQKIIVTERIRIHYILLNLLNVLLLVSIFGLDFTPFVSASGVLKDGLISLLIAILLILNVFKPERNLFYKLLNIRLVKYIGVLSYSIYIWHTLFTDTENKPFPAICYNFPFVYICIFVVAFLSYNFIEKPFLRLKRRFEVPTYPQPATFSLAGSTE